jgi:eukaryotic-like serine/threonine-protein kinase
VFRKPEIYHVDQGNVLRWNHLVVYVTAVKKILDVDAIESADEQGSVDSVMTADKESTAKIFLPQTDRDLPESLPRGFEKYTDFQPMNSGGTAVLTSCWDSIVGRTVALKRLLPKFADDPHERRRLLREARITAQLQHPNTVPVYEIGQNEGGIYFTMKLLAGENLFKVIQRLSWGDAATERDYPLEGLLEVIIQVGLALASAHVHGVIHRDVKPENIWLGKFGEVMLLDWGVAKVWGVPNQDGENHSADNSHELSGSPDDGQLQTLTLSGQRPGTPLYMSPEQVSGESDIDERTDVFSLGVVMYEMLAFKEPFRGRVIRETFDNILHVTPPSPRELRPQRNIPESLVQIVFKALEKKADDRFPTIYEMVEAIRGIRKDLH